MVVAGLGTVAVGHGLAGCTEVGADKEDEEDDDDPKVDVSGEAGTWAE